MDELARVINEYLPKFQFPSNGKVYPKITQMGKRCSNKYKSFNSLQTGKCIQSIAWRIYRQVRERWFQFPSNGKVYPKNVFWYTDGRMEVLFQFPSNGKAYPKFSPSDPEYGSRFRFNSLQTGKCIQSISRRVTRAGVRTCFNSLQTGKCIQRWQLARKGGQQKSFNSLQTGKCIQSITQRTSERHSLHSQVSIPFKRESVSKVFPRSCTSFGGKWFQFPSNGKADPKKFI